VAREVRVCFEALGAGSAADQDRSGQCAAAGLGEQLGAVGLDQGPQLVLKRGDLTRQSTDLRELLTRDAHASAYRQPSQLAVQALKARELVS